MTKVAGAATAAAPYVRRALSDEQVRDDLRAVLGAVRHLVDEFSSDDRVRKLVTDDRLREDIDEILEAMQDAGRRVLEPRRQVPWGWVFFWGGLAGAAAAALALPQSRAAIVRGYHAMRGRAAEMTGTSGETETPLSRAA